MKLKKLKSIVILVGFLVIVIVGGLIFSKSKNLTQSNRHLPEENTLYLTTYRGEDQIFFTNKTHQTFFDPGSSSARESPYVGESDTSNGGRNFEVDFTELSNPKKIYSVTQEIDYVSGFKLNNAKNIVYISFAYFNKLDDSYPGTIDKIIKIKLDTLSTSEFWSNEVSSKKYEGAEGSAVINTVADDRYMTIKLFDCYGCEPRIAGTVVLNLNTKKEKYYKDSDNIQFNITNNTLSYQSLVPVEIPCIEGPRCNNGQEIDYRLSEKVFTENLP